MKNRKLFIGVGIVGALLVCCVLGGLFGQTGKPAKPTPIPESPQTAVPSIPTTIPIPATSAPAVNPADAAYVDGWLENVNPLSDGMIEAMGGIADAAEVGDIDEICRLAETLVEVSVASLVALEDLASPEHPYLVNSSDHNKKGVTNIGAAGIALLDFCDTGDLDELEVSIALTEAGGEELTLANDWLDMYREEIE